MKILFLFAKTEFRVTIKRVSSCKKPVSSYNKPSFEVLDVLKSELQLQKASKKASFEF